MKIYQKELHNPFILIHSKSLILTYCLTFVIQNLLILSCQVSLLSIWKSSTVFMQYKHTISRDLGAFEGVGLLNPRATEKHWGEGGFVLICCKLPSLLCFRFSRSRVIDMLLFSASSGLLQNTVIHNWLTREMLEWGGKYVFDNQVYWTIYIDNAV